MRRAIDIQEPFCSFAETMPSMSQPGSSRQGRYPSFNASKPQRLPRNGLQRDFEGESKAEANAVGRRHTASAAAGVILGSPRNGDGLAHGRDGAMLGRGAALAGLDTQAQGAFSRARGPVGAYLLFLLVAVSITV